jgi:hypothetical protein
VAPHGFLRLFRFPFRHIAAGDARLDRVGAMLHRQSARH